MLSIINLGIPTGILFGGIIGIVLNAFFKPRKKNVAYLISIMAFIIFTLIGGILLLNI